MIRFNEAVDRAVAESVAFYAIETQRWRDTLLATIAHDLCNPMSEVLMSVKALAELGPRSTPDRFIPMLKRSSAACRSFWTHCWN